MILNRSYKGISLLEIIIAITFLALIFLGLFGGFSFSHKEITDNYYRFIALSLAREPIEVFRAFGYHWLINYEKHPIAKYPVNVGFTSIDDLPFEPDQHPPDATLFEREITIEPIEDGKMKAVKVTVKVRSKKDIKNVNWLGSEELILNSLIVEIPR